MLVRGLLRSTLCSLDCCATHVPPGLLRHTLYSQCCCATHSFSRAVVRCSLFPLVTHLCSSAAFSLQLISRMIGFDATTFRVRAARLHTSPSSPVHQKPHPTAPKQRPHFGSRHSPGLYSILGHHPFETLTYHNCHRRDARRASSSRPSRSSYGRS